MLEIDPTGPCGCVAIKSDRIVFEAEKNTQNTSKTKRDRAVAVVTKRK